MSSLISKTKFFSLSEKTKHKLASELLRKAYLDKNLFSHYQKLEELLSLPPIPYSKEALSDRYHEHLHKATITLKEDSFLPSVTHLDSLSDEPFLPIDIYLDNLRSLHNVGSIIRTTEAFRLGEIHFSEKTPFINHPKIEKSAMGTSALVTCHQNTPLSALKEPLIAIETAKDATPLYDFTFPKSFSLLFGNEEYGLSGKTLSSAHSIIKIPLLGSKNSLNVASAFAILASEIRRQLNRV
ncbi:MAG: RNA methyltransferase [Chlamydiae bacterium]|jgi:tRNA G18 (ribose-2'-O)-methylase SpoU|nr:RNA methyltransferase [Chlamydiota bacterium]